MSTEEGLLNEMAAVLPGVRAEGLVLHSGGGLESVFPVSELATAALGAAALAAAAVAGATEVRVDRRRASAWFDRSLYPVGWALASPWDPIAGDYRSLDGWIRLHTNAPAHRAAALSVLGMSVLGAENAADAVVAAVATWSGAELEAAIVDAGGCAAVMRTPDEWAHSVPGIALANEPLIAWQDLGAGRVALHSASADRPLRGVRVLDLTRILAGPVATRYLALLGADVLRIDPPDWDETLIPEVTLGKRTARLDLTNQADRDAFSALLTAADVIVHGYRPGALDGLGFGEADRQRLRPGLIDVSLNAYGWSGPLAGRRGFDSLVQMSTGIADAGMRETHADRPRPLPVQGLDHATGHLMAAATLSALAHQRETGVGRSARLSLARTAQVLLGRRGEGNHTPFRDLNDDDFVAHTEATSWGDARRLRYPSSIGGVTLEASPARALGLDRPVWR
ncbi:CoA transferase [Glaciibacter psychrotolerans]|uniref:Acyl-CoA transferase n=1 Tax=Glaciibacter psychrotolerans TaxID=670054 RepID=A0A7Z0ECN6_9MICO|nr:CoA transferase [Leifsonia psychrotolerans]NYJ19242.1 hypothetical protein [Leifsonia psychrotolerans]